MESRYELCALDFELTLTRRETAATPAADQTPAAAKPPVIDLATILEAATRLDPVRSGPVIRCANTLPLTTRHEPRVVMPAPDLPHGHGCHLGVCGIEQTVRFLRHDHGRHLRHQCRPALYPRSAPVE